MARQSTKIQIEGADGLRRKFRRLAGDMRPAISAAVVQAAENIQAGARARVPVGATGDLQAGIGLKVEEGGMDARVGFGRDVFYGLFVEFGHKGEPPRPFLGPAAIQERKKFVDRVRTAVDIVIERVRAAG